MNKRYIIKIVKDISKENIFPYYLSELHAGYANENDHTASFSYKIITSKKHAMIFNSVAEVKMVWEFVSTYNKIHHKAYKIEMEEYYEV